MEFFIVCLAVIVLVLFLFACSITSFLNQLPKCRKATKKAIDRTFVRLGFFMNLEENANILSNMINQLNTLMQELEESPKSDAVRNQVHLRMAQEEAVKVRDEARGIINTGWHKRWSSRSCYQLSTRVAANISNIEWKLNCDSLISKSKDDGIPGIAVVFLIAYALTNAVLHLPYSKTAKADVIDWIVIEVAYPFKLKNYLQRLKEEVIVMISRRSCWEKGQGKFLEIELGYNASGLKEAELVHDQAECMINYWYKGWTGSRYRLSKSAHKSIKNLRRSVLRGGGTNSRKIILSIDRMSQILPGAITDIRHYLHVDTNIELLKQLVHGSVRGKLSAADVQKLEKEVKLLEAAQDEAMQLIQQAQSCLDKHWYIMWPASRFRLPKRLAKKTIQVRRLEEDLNWKFGKLRDTHKPFRAIRRRHDSF